MKAILMPHFIHNPTRSIIILFVSLAFPFFCFASDPVKTLASTPDFAFGGVGEAAVKSLGELAFREVMARRSAKEDFLKLLKSGNAQARCYALVGLRKLSPEKYSSYAAPFMNDKTNVSVARGCCIGPEPMSSLVIKIGRGNYDHYLK